MSFWFVSIFSITNAMIVLLPLLLLFQSETHLKNNINYCYYTTFTEKDGIEMFKCWHSLICNDSVKTFCVSTVRSSVFVKTDHLRIDTIHKTSHKRGVLRRNSNTFTQIRNDICNITSNETVLNQMVDCLKIY